MNQSPQLNTLFYGDCLRWMEKWSDACVDLIYLDPPFNSKTDYNILYSPKIMEKAEAQKKAFRDTWTWDEDAIKRVKKLKGASAHPAHKAINGLEQLLGDSGMLAYLSYMAERLGEMKRLLKETGSIYLHCDPHASHYLKILMDNIFGKENFRNEIIWSYRRWPASSQKFQSMHDVILRYSVGGNIIWNQLYEPLAQSTLDTFGTKKQVADFSSGHRKPSQTNEDTEGASMRDVWDIGIIAPSANERTGYPTQKPLDLLARIINASSNKGDVVLDPFCGCGSAVLAADSLERKFLGIDISPLATDLVHYRFKKGTGNKKFTTKTPSDKIKTKGIPTTIDGAEKLAKDNPFDFEEWAITRIHGLVPNDKKVGDGGIDGRGVLAEKIDETPLSPDKDAIHWVFAQVTGGKFHLNHFKSFVATLTQEKEATMGIYITLHPITSPQAKKIMIEMGDIKADKKDYPKLQNWTIENFFNKIEAHLPPMLDPFTGKKTIGNLGL